MKKGIILLLFTIIAAGASAQENSILKQEGDGFKWYHIYHDNYKYVSAENVEHREIVPAYRQYDGVYCDENGMFVAYYKNGDSDYRTSYYTRDGDLIIDANDYDETCLMGKGYAYPYFSVTKNGLMGACDIHGKEVVRPEYESVIYDASDGFKVQPKGGRFQPLGVMLPSSSSSILASYAGRGAGGSTTTNPSGSAYTSSNATSGSSSYSSSYTDMRTTDTKTAKDLFDQAVKLPDSRQAEAAQLYRQIISQDPNNREGWTASACNNLGVLYYNNGDYKTAIEYYEKALAFVPGNAMVKDNIKKAKSQRRSQRWNAISGALGAMSDALNNASGSTTTSGYGSSTSYGGGSTSYGGGSSSYGGSSSTPAKCRMCGGSGRCTGGTLSSARYHCHGSGKCGWCNGDGYNYTAGNPVKCSRCNGKGKCTYCGGSGKCSTCHGTGHA